MSLPKIHIMTNYRFKTCFRYGQSHRCLANTLSTGYTGYFFNFLVSLFRFSVSKTIKCIEIDENTTPRMSNTKKTKNAKVKKRKKRKNGKAKNGKPGMKTQEAKKRSEDSIHRFGSKHNCAARRQ